MEALVEKKRELEDELEKLDEQRNAIYEQLEKIKDEITKIHLDDLQDHYKEALIKRMMRLKAYIDTQDDGVQLAYKIEHIEQPLNDDHDPCRDYVEWSIEERDLLEMAQFVQVRFKIHAEVVKKFVEGWLNENIPNMSTYNWIRD